MDVLTELRNSCHSAEIKLYPNAFKYFCYSKSFLYEIYSLGNGFLKLLGNCVYGITYQQLYYTGHKELSYMHICVFTINKTPWQLPI